MTSLVVWTGADTRGPASLNMATDSRISWEGAGAVSHHWDQAKKVFASATTPLVVGYVGDVLFPLLVLPNLIDRIDRRVFPSSGAAVNGLVSVVRHEWKSYPAEERRPVTFYVGYRQGDGMSARFLVTQLSVKRADEWIVRDISVPEKSSCLAVDGSGKVAVRSALDDWQASSAADTSRAVFSGFVDSVIAGVDPRSGGAPQLGCLYRVGPGRLLGIIHDGQRYFAGTRLIGNEEVDNVEWRNALFERADGRKKSRLSGAQAQPRPSDLRSSQN